MKLINLIYFIILINHTLATINYGKAVVMVPKHLNGYFLISGDVRTWFESLITQAAGDDFIMKYTIFDEIEQNEVCRLVFYDDSEDV